MFVDYEALKDLRRPTVISVGDNLRGEVERWDEFYNFPYCVRSKPYQYVDDKPTGWNEEMDEVIEELSAKIEALRKKGQIAIGSEHNLAKGEEQRWELEMRLNDLVAQRRELSKWEFREIARCLFGHGTVLGKHYDYLNHGTIEDISDEGGGMGAIRPVYRSADDWIFRVIKTVEEEKTGVVGGKRRRFGFTWVSVQDDVYDASFKEGTTFFITKDDPDFHKYYSRVEFMLSRRPKFLRPEVVKSSVNEKAFKFISNAKVLAVKKKFGLIKENHIPREFSFRGGLPKFISTLAGETVSKVKVDEIGEIGNISDVWQIIAPALLKGNSLERAGCFIGLGTVGKMEASGQAFKRFFKNHAAFDLHKIMIPGWMGIDVDENGNSNREVISTKIRATVKKYEKAGLHDMAILERQKFPLEEDDMFLQDNSKIIMPQHILEMMTARREENGPDHGLVFGVFVKGSSGKPEFIEQEPNPPKDPSDPGQARHIGYRQWVFVKGEQFNKNPHIRNSYVAGCDPIDMDTDIQKSGKGNRSFLKHSDITCLIHKRIAEVGGDDQMPVGLYCSRSEDLDDEYEQIALAMAYFGSKVNIERQKGQRMYSWLKKHGYAQYVAYAVDVASLDKRQANVWGYSATEGTWGTHISLGKDHLKKHHEKIQFERLIDELYRVKQDNTDAVVAYFAALQFSYELDVREEKSGKEYNEDHAAIAVPQFVRDGNGRIVPRAMLNGSNAFGAERVIQAQYNRAAEIELRQQMIRNGKKRR